MEGNQQPRNCTLRQEAGAEEQGMGGVGSGPEEGEPSQPLRAEFPRTNRLLPHGRNQEGGERWEEQHISQPRPARARWPHATHWNEDAAEYDEDGYIVSARRPNWPEDTHMAPPWRGGVWRDRAHLPRSSVPVRRRPFDRMQAMEHVYRDGYEDRQPQRRGVYEESEPPAYGRAPNTFVSKQLLVGDILPRMPASTSTLQPNPLASTALMRGAAHVKEPGTSTVVEDVYSFETHNPQSSATKTTATAEHIEVNNPKLIATL